MASIKKIEGKTGTSYKITVTKGRDSSGKQIRHFKTWTPDRPMTARQMEKEAQRVALDFEREIDLGFQVDNRQTFEQYARYFVKMREQQGVAKNTLISYGYYLDRILPVFGHMKITDIRPKHLSLFYQNLMEAGVKRTTDTARVKVDFEELIAQTGKTKTELSKMWGVSLSQVKKLCNGGGIEATAAKRITKAIGRKEIFEFVDKSEGLSARTVQKYHGFLSAVFAMAEKEMIIPYNPASKAMIPTEEKREPNYFQPEQIAQILEALEHEPLKYKVMIHLFIVTGCRRGEILALTWEKIDFASKQIKIDRTLSYQPKAGVFEGPTKTKCTRYVSLPNETIRLLRKYKTWWSEEKLKRGDLWANADHLFLQKDGKPIAPNDIKNTVVAHKPSLVIIDPWHAFLGAGVDINRVNALRPVFQKLAHLAKQCQCAMVLVSHVNKRAQGENANNAATGSSDFINASRSAFRVIFDNEDEDCRVMVHTKTNYAAYGKSIRYRIDDGGVAWDGFSDITKQTLEMAARRRSTPWEVMQGDKEHSAINSALIDALEGSANQFVPTRYSYDEFKKLHGDLIFGGSQPKRALEAVKDRLADDGYYLKVCAVKVGGQSCKGFMIQRIDSTEPEQVVISE